MSRGGFSWKRAVGISAAKSRLSRSIGIPLTKSGRQRKVGKMVTGGGCLVAMTFLVLVPFALVLGGGRSLVLKRALTKDRALATQGLGQVRGIPFALRFHAASRAAILRTRLRPTKREQ